MDTLYLAQVLDLGNNVIAQIFSGSRILAVEGEVPSQFNLLVGKEEISLCIPGYRYTPIKIVVIKDSQGDV